MLIWATLRLVAWWMVGLDCWRVGTLPRLLTGTSSGGVSGGVSASPCDGWWHVCLWQTDSSELHQSCSSLELKGGSIESWGGRGLNSLRHAGKNEVPKTKNAVNKWVQKKIIHLLPCFCSPLSFESAVELHTAPLDEEQSGMWLMGLTLHGEELVS